MTELVVSDIGGTNARFALATLEDGEVTHLGEPHTYQAREHASLQTAWEHFAKDVGRPLPRIASFGIAAPVGEDLIKLVNSPWMLRKSALYDLGLDRVSVVNDFDAIGHAVAKLPDSDFLHLCGPDQPLPDRGVISISGPGTGLGIASVLRAGSHYHVIPTEGGHQDFAPVDSIDDQLLARLRKTLTRVSVERVVSGPGIVAIYQTLAAIEGRAVPDLENKAIWTMALDGSDSLARAAMERFFLSLGSMAGDIALAHGAKAAVIAGGLGLRLKDHFAASGFAQRFTAKGRFADIMAAMPVKLITHPQPGLYGAGVAFDQEHGL